MAVSLLLLTDQRPLGYATGVVAPVLMVISLWFWVDINEELADQPTWRPLPLAVKVWRWAFSGFGLLSLGMGATGLRCMQELDSPACLSWLEAPQGIHGLAATVFNFLFGGLWTEAVAAFVGYVALGAYLAGLLQWLLVRLPRYGRVAGEF